MLNEKLRFARQKKHWSQNRAAAEIGIDRKTYIRWENGQNHPQPGTLELACKAFGLSAEELGFTGISSFKGTSRATITSLEAASQTVPLNGTQMQQLEPAEEQELGEQYYLNVALQILEMAASKYQWSSDVLVAKVDELKNVMKKSDAGEVSRRQFILFGTNAIFVLSNLSMLVPEEILPFTDRNIATCWQMSNGSRDDLLHTRWMLSSYLPTLTQLATQPSSQQKTAAKQVAACYGLRSLLGYHLESLEAAGEDAKQFLYYSKLTEDPEWIVRAHVRFALISYYRGLPERALVACREANCYKNQVPPAALFSLYKEQAAYEAVIGLKDEANASLHLAYENLVRATHRQSRTYVDTSLYEWALWKGITHYHLGEYKEAQATLASVAPLNPDNSLPERVRTGLLNNLILAELRAEGCDMEHFIMLW